MSSGGSKPKIFDLHEKDFKVFQNFIIAILAVLIFFVIFFFSPNLRDAAIWFFFETSPFWMLYILLHVTEHAWMHWRIHIFLHKAGSVLLEIKLPKEILKSPLAMELVFTSLYQTGSASYVETYVGGKVRPWFSFEMVSEEGNIRFFIWTHRKFKDLVESQIYSQYPNVEIYEVADKDDYVHKVQLGGQDGSEMWGTYFVLGKPSVYPIKTYIDFGMQDNPKEEYKIDPMTPVIEYLGSMKKGETAWIQILIQAHKKEGRKEGHLLGGGKKFWTDAGKKEIDKLMHRDSATKASETNSEGVPQRVLLTDSERELTAAMDRKLSKWPFECAIRGFYINKKGAFNPISITGLIGTLRQYSSKDMNEFKLGWFTDFDYPWQDYHRIRRNKMEKQMLSAYKKRSFFQGPYQNFHSEPFILNTEELATIYHFPGEVATTPTFARIPSKKVEPPSNLPV